MTSKNHLTKLAFVKKAGILDWIGNLFGKSYSTQNVGKKTFSDSFSQLIRDVARGKGGRGGVAVAVGNQKLTPDLIKRLEKAAPAYLGEHIVEQQPWKAVALSAPIATGIGAYAYGKHRGDSAKTDAEIAKGIKDLGSMLANPELYGNNSNNISDFTSI